LDTVEREGYRLRSQYQERKSTRTGLLMSWLTLSSVLHARKTEARSRLVLPHLTGK